VRSALPAFGELAAQLFAASGTRPQLACGSRRILPYFHERNRVVVVRLVDHPQLRLEWRHGDRLRHLLIQLDTIDARLLQNVLEQTHLCGIR